MSIPFFKKSKSGYCIQFAKSLYPRQALLKLKDMYSESAVIVSEKGKYFELKSKAWTEEDCLVVCENFLYLAKHASHA